MLQVKVRSSKDQMVSRMFFYKENIIWFIGSGTLMLFFCPLIMNTKYSWAVEVSGDLSIWNWRNRGAWMCCPTTNMASGICPGSAVLPVDFADTTFYFAFTENISWRLPCSWESPIYAACFPAPANICLCLVSSFFFLLPAGFLIRTSS